MRVASLVARIVLGLIFLASGISGFFLVSHPPAPPPGLAGDFMTIFFASRWVLFVDGLEAICGALLLADRFVPLALVVLAGIIFNMFVFHATMMPLGLPAPLVMGALWFLIAWPLRAHFSPLLLARPATRDGFERAA